VTASQTIELVIVTFFRETVEISYCTFSVHFSYAYNLFPQQITQLILMFLHVWAVNCSYPPGAASVEHVYSMLYMLSNINGKMCKRISAMPQMFSVMKFVLKL